MSCGRLSESTPYVGSSSMSRLRWFNTWKKATLIASAISVWCPPPVLFAGMYPPSLDGNTSTV